MDYPTCRQELWVLLPTWAWADREVHKILSHLCMLKAKLLWAWDILGSCVSRLATSQRDGGCSLASRFALLQSTNVCCNKAGFGKQGLSDSAAGGSTPGSECKSQNCEWHFIYSFAVDIKAKELSISSIHPNRFCFNPPAVSAGYLYQEGQSQSLNVEIIPHSKTVSWQLWGFGVYTRGYKRCVYGYRKKKRGLTASLTMIQLNRKPAPHGLNLHSFMKSMVSYIRTYDSYSSIWFWSQNSAVFWLSHLDDQPVKSLKLPMNSGKNKTKKKFKF